MEVKNKFEELAGPVMGYDVESIQVNLGRVCNLSCSHCHLEASPSRSEIMPWAVMEKLLQVVKENQIHRVELTGGAPELNPYFSAFVSALCELGVSVKVRTNLVALLEPGLESLPPLLREKEVALAASLPCYLERNVRQQRGDNVFNQSIMALSMLNKLGYGTDIGPELELVFNPGEALLPGNQSHLETVYREELYKRYGIVFTRLLVLANVPVGRFRSSLIRQGRAKEYMNLLRYSFNRRTLDGLMCRRQLSVDWDGTLYDCDFNLALGTCVSAGPTHVSAFSRKALANRVIATEEHCFACTAGAGSSCSGALEVKK